MLGCLFLGFAFSICHNLFYSLCDIVFLCQGFVKFLVLVDNIQFNYQINCKLTCDNVVFVLAIYVVFELILMRYSLSWQGNLRTTFVY